MVEVRELSIDWNKFKVKAKGKHLENSKNAYIEFCEMLDEVDFELVSDYAGNRNKVELIYKFDNNIKLSMRPDAFKRTTYKVIINFKNNLIENNDKFIKFIDTTRKGNLIVKIKTFDTREIDVDISKYSKWNNARKDTYDYCEKKNYKILSPYIESIEKILIDFNCGHEPNWISPASLKQGHGCPKCDESKGEREIRLYLEKNNIEFMQEYKFDNCKYKDFLRFDFCIPSLNLCIEFDGEQHFKEKDFFGGKDSLRLTQERDEIKNNINFIFESTNSNIVLN